MNVSQQIFSHTFPNGLTLLSQPMPWLESAAFSLSLPAGCRFDPPAQIGLANFTCEMVQRGCGELDSRGFIETLEYLGVDYSSSVSVFRSNFGGAMPADQLLDSLAVYRDVFVKPHLPADQIEDARQVCFQEIGAIQDDLAQRTMIELRMRHYGDPDGRICEGTMESVQSITLDDVVRFHKRYYQPRGAIIAVAGRHDWQALKDHIGKLFADWRPAESMEPQIAPPLRGNYHIPFKSNQTHIAVAFPCVPYAHDDYFKARAAVGVLSDGMSSRLFSEVREKRGLCYTVSASCNSNRELGAVLCYCGTSADRAQESLDVLIEQLVNLKNGVEQAELDRLKIQIRSGLIMQQESCRTRAGSIAGDWFFLGRVRTLEETNELISDLTVADINEYVAANPPSNFDIVTLGPEPLELREDGISATSAR